VYIFYCYIKFEKLHCKNNQRKSVRTNLEKKNKKDFEYYMHIVTHRLSGALKFTMQVLYGNGT